MPTPSLSLRQAFWGFSSLFLFLFFGRLAYGYFYPQGLGTNDSPFQMEFSSSGGRKNYASEKIRKQDASSSQAPLPNQPGVLTQKYEKVATLNAKTSQFEQDEAEAKGQIKAFEAVIQFEQSNGNPGNRSLQLLVGIQPERFDSFYVEMQKIGRLQNKQVSKTDKTNEYLQLNAQITSLVKTRDALLELKRRGGRIDEYIGLENRVLEIETQLQGLGVQIGDYDEENEFCSVRFTLLEGGTTQIGIGHRIKVALEWAAMYFCMLTFGLALALVGALILLQVLDKIRNVQKMPPT